MKAKNVIFIPIRNNVLKMQPLTAFCKEQYFYLFHTMANVIPPIVENLKSLNIDNFDDIQIDSDKAKDALNESITHISDSFSGIPRYAEVLIGLSLKDLPEIDARYIQQTMYITTSAYHLLNGPTPDDFDSLKVLFETLLAVQLLKGAILAEKDVITKYALELQVKGINPIYGLFSFKKPLFEVFTDIINEPFLHLTIAERNLLTLTSALGLEDAAPLYRTNCMIGNEEEE